MRSRTPKHVLSCQEYPDHQDRLGLGCVTQGTRRLNPGTMLTLKVVDLFLVAVRRQPPRKGRGRGCHAKPVSCPSGEATRVTSAATRTQKLCSAECRWARWALGWSGTQFQVNLQMQCPESCHVDYHAASTFVLELAKFDIFHNSIFDVTI